MARCPICQETIPSGSNCLVEDTDCISHVGDGDNGSEFALSPILSADPNQLLECGDGLGGFLPALFTNPPTVQAYRTSPQAIANDTLTAITLNVERWDNDGMHDLVSNTNRITFTTAGKYMVSWLGGFLPQAGTTQTESYRLIVMRKNGTDILARDSRSAINDGFGVVIGQTLIAEEEFAINDYVEVLVRHNAGATINYASDSYSPVFSAYRWAA